MNKITLELVIEFAENFECCPECGDVNDGALYHHLCEKCNKRVAIPDDAYYFAQWLKKVIEWIDMP
jgi:hypothetical protein